MGVPVPTQVPAAPGVAASRPVLARLAAALGECPTPVVVVLDGASQLPGRDWAAGLEFLQSHASDLRLVLSGRWDPPLPLYRYRLAGKLHAAGSTIVTITHDLAIADAFPRRVEIRDGELVV